MKIAVVQMCSKQEPERNWQDIESAFKLAAEERADLVAFPENVLAIAAKRDQLNSEDWSSWSKAFQKACKLRGIACLVGSLPESEESGLFYASSLMIDKTGEVLANYRKLHLFDVDIDDEVGGYRESNTYKAGDKPVMVNFMGWKIGLSICFDLRYPRLYQFYADNDVELVLVPSAFTALTGEKHWQALLQARAIETQCYFIAPNQVGEHDDGRKTWGHSMVVDPDGKILVDMKDQQGIRFVELQKSKVTEARRSIPLRPNPGI